MSRFIKHLSALTLCLAATVTFAAPPANLITHNKTSLESNAFIAGTIPSTSPTKANSTNVVPWFVVQMACYGHVVNRLCPATIMMATNTAKPFELGKVSLNMDTGEIKVVSVTANGYKLTINGRAEATLSKE